MSQPKPRRNRLEFQPRLCPQKEQTAPGPTCYSLALKAPTHETGTEESCPSSPHSKRVARADGVQQRPLTQGTVDRAGTGIRVSDGGHPGWAVASRGWCAVLGQLVCAVVASQGGARARGAWTWFEGPQVGGG